MIKRTLKLPDNKSFFLFGPRQTGKSTLLKSLFLNEATYYYDLLKTEEFVRLSAHPELFREEVISRGQKIKTGQGEPSGRPGVDLSAASSDRRRISGPVFPAQGLADWFSAQRLPGRIRRRRASPSPFLCGNLS